jgi:general stress protein 26
VDSINKNQPEDNHADLRGAAAVKQIRTIVEKAQSCFFCTAAASGDSHGARPMNVRQVDDQGNLWFLSADDSHKNEELAGDPTVTLYFQGSPHSDFLFLRGKATLSRDKAKIKELWTPTIGTWFTDGVDDPRITVIRVTPTEGHYWDTKHGDWVAGIKILLGSMIGKTLDDSVEGALRV